MEMAERLDMSEGRLDNQQLDLILRDFGALATLPGVISRISDLALRARDAQQTGGDVGEEIVAVIRLDPALTARFLSLAGRLGGAAPATVPEALAGLPLEWVLSTALSAEVFCPGGPLRAEPVGLDRREFWRHCLAVALAAEMLAAEPHEPQEPGQAFVCGLLHDAGKLVLEQAMPRSFRRVLDAAGQFEGGMSACEREVIGTDHSVVGRRWAQRLRLPEAVQAVSWLAGQPFESIPASVPQRWLVGVVSLGEAIAREMRIGFSGSDAPAVSSGDLAGVLGVSSEALQRTVETLDERVARAGRRLGLDGALDAAAYAQALAGANAELGRLSGELQQQAERLAGKASALALLRDFGGSLGPDVTVSEVVACVADVTAEAFGRTPSPIEPVVAYSISDGQGRIVAAAANAAEGAGVRTFARGDGLSARADAPAGASGRELLDVIVAEPDEFIEWADVSACSHVPLLCGRRWVGGVLAPAQDRDGDEAFDALAGVLAPALAMVQGAERDRDLSEQLAGKSRALAATQEALAEAKTLAAVGEMAAGAAHELNTPLAVVSGRAQLMREKARTDKQRQTWALMAEQAQRISDIISELMDFASPPAPAAAPFDVGELLREVAEAFSGSDHPQAKAVDVDITVGDATPPVHADRAQIRGVLLELMANAANAAAETPMRIRLACRPEEIRNAVLVTVEDDGAGMDEATADRVFTPFFSRQQAGRRRGLGLSRAKRCVESNGGRVWIKTRPGEGTTVFVRLPPAK